MIKITSLFSCLFLKWFPYKLTRLFSDQNNETHSHFFRSETAQKPNLSGHTEFKRGVYLRAARFLTARQGFKIEQSPREKLCSQLTQINQ